ncbi:MAG: hypothetical protein IJB71_01985 [Bacilli bacterium]|nr:hypothetical protein [Bacilli bacterium]
MKESIWGYLVIVIGIVMIFIIIFLQNTTNIDEHNMSLLKETTEASMTDAIDWNSYKSSGVVKISQGAFIESFIRRFAENAMLSSTYKIEFYKIQEEPPLVNIRVFSSETTTATGSEIKYTLTNTINAILETDTSVEIEVE